MAVTDDRRALEVVAALEEEHGPPGRRARSPATTAGQLGEVAGREGEVGQRVGAVGVEAGRDQHPRRGERGSTTGVDQSIEGPPHHVAGGPRGQRHVDGGARGPSGPPTSEARPVPG